MNPETLQFLLRLTVIWAALLAYYWTFLRRAPFGWQRGFLLVTIVLGVAIPSLPAWEMGEGLAQLRVMIEVGADRPISELDSTLTGPVRTDWLSYWMTFWVLGSFLFWARTLVQWWKIRSYGRSGVRSRYAGFDVIRHAAVPGPFAAFGRIYLPAGMSNGPLSTTALLHEAVHLRARHHLDVLVLTTLTNIFWFHPLAWLLRHRLAAVHEFEADAAVAREVSVKVYGRQLLQFSLQAGPFPGLFSSPLKTRIRMLTQFQALRRPGVLASLLFLLLVGGLSLACSKTASPVVLSAADVHQKSRLPPIYERNFIKRVYADIDYPKLARKAGKDGHIRAEINRYGNPTIVQIFVAPIAETKSSEISADVEVVVIGHYPEAIEAYEPEGEWPFEQVVSRVVNPLVAEEAEALLGSEEVLPPEFFIDFIFQLEE